MVLHAPALHTSPISQIPAIMSFPDDPHSDQDVARISKTNGSLEPRARSQPSVMCPAAWTDKHGSVPEKQDSLTALLLRSNDWLLRLRLSKRHLSTATVFKRPRNSAVLFAPQKPRSTPIRLLCPLPKGSVSMGSWFIQSGLPPVKGNNAYRSYV